jgi:hypothetical protein
MGLKVKKRGRQERKGKTRRTSARGKAGRKDALAVQERIRMERALGIQRGGR